MNQGIRSKHAKVNTGIPQGSNLGPTLFLIYVNDMYCMNLKSTVAQFADDTVLYYSDNDIDVLCNTVQKDLNEVSGWCCFNKLKVNAAKTKAMFFDVRPTGQKAHLANMNINSSPVEYVDKYEYLGVTIDTNLNFKRHIEKSFNRINNKLYMFSYMRKSLNRKAAITVYKSMVLPCFEYGNVFLSSCIERDYKTTKQGFTKSFV